MPGWLLFASLLINFSLQLLDPAVNSLSYLVVLDSLKGYDGISAEDRAVATIQFFTSFDARQIRYAGDTFLSYLRHMASDRFILPVRTSYPYCRTIADNAQP